MSDTMNLVNAVEEVKDKLTSKEYKDILDNAMKIHNASSNLDVHAGIHEVYVEGLHTIMEEIGGFSMRGFGNAALPSRVPELVETIVRDIHEQKQCGSIDKAKQDWYDSNICGWVDIYDLERLIKESSYDDTHEKALFYVYLYRWGEIPEKYEERISDLFDWDLWGCHYGAYNDSDITDDTTINELWNMMYESRQQHYLTYDFVEAISVY